MGGAGDPPSSALADVLTGLR